MGTFARHPWNVDFEWQPSAPPHRCLREEQVAAFDRDGFVVVPDVFDAATVAEVVEEIDRREAEVEAFLRSAEDERFTIAEAGAITFAINLAVRSEVLGRFARHPFLAGVCADLVGPDVDLYWDQAVYKKPEKPRRFPWHQDNGYGYVRPQQYLTCWVALTDANEANGCPQVAPGLHRLGTLAHTYVDPLGWECFTEPPEVAVAEVGAGGIVVFSSLTPHLTGPNRTDATRKAYILQYAPAGAVRLQGEPPDPPTGEIPALDPAHGFPLLRGGAPVDP